MAKRSADPFLLAFDTWRLGLEAAEVMWQRSWLIAQGGARGEAEARRMIEEKALAHAEFGWLLATGQAGRSPKGVTRKALTHYGRRVRANRKRLSR